ncbi:MAG TPA: zinc ABC transporter substrate-binding protein [Thermomicrobiaceae bacterium]|nr:zinc ABC transporter substrate-binding protein [Thermomicrobiaceae bacterium]
MKRLWRLGGILAVTLVLAACGGAMTGPGTTGAGTGASPAAADGRLQVVAAENFWGSIAAQLGGDKVQVTSLIVNPNTDPHSYEPTPADARTVADARYVILNGAGYDPWVQKLLDANPVGGRRALNVGDLVGKKAGDNPHLWYNPDYVDQVVARITADYQALDPADAAYFAQQQTQFTTSGLKDYHDLLSTIRQQYAGTPVGSTESIFVYMAGALGLNLTTPPGFMNAVSQGTDTPAADKATFDRQVTQKQIDVLILNRQNATPDTDAVKSEAQAQGIPVVNITETLDPANVTFQAWQAGQLTALKQALAQATGK